MDCFGTCFTHAQTSDVKPRCLEAFSAKVQAPLKPSEGEAPFKPPWSPSKPPSPSEGFKPPSSPLEAPLKPPSTFLKTFDLPPPPSPPDPSSPLEGGFWRGYLGTSPLWSAIFLRNSPWKYRLPTVLPYPWQIVPSSWKKNPLPLAQGRLGSNPRVQVVGASRFHALVDS